MDWPWREARKEAPHLGVTRWIARSPAQHAFLCLTEFDLAANPRLRLELYDQDEDDAHPFDNFADYFRHGIGEITRRLNQRPGRVIAAWNGLFFDAGYEAGGRHVAPVVLRRQAYYDRRNYRWTFGVVRKRNQVRFEVLHLPDGNTLAGLDYAAGGAQCLIREGRPLRIQPPPKPGDPPLRRPVPCAPDEAGHIPVADHVNTSRTSMGWSRDSDRLYVLIVRADVKEDPGPGGWLLADLQRFWQSLGVWGAVNVDGGPSTQFACLRADGRYDVIPPTLASKQPLLTLSDDSNNSPGAGSLMYFYVREEP